MPHAGMVRKREARSAPPELGSGEHLTAAGKGWQPSELKDSMQAPLE